ncbi:hypothetical protein M758_UG159400 [Ceratodon purpureus]|nr:hypothetical protein M758_UG159400 [Ceratodon purpureus]
MIGCHDVAHRTNLAAKALTELPLFESVEILLRKTHNYFSHSPKRHLEFVKLAEVMETKGLRLLKNVQTRWVLLLEPLRRFLAQYRVVMAKMAEDIDDNSDAQENLDVLLDPYTLLGMTGLQPLLETVNTLVEFAQGRNVFVSDFVGALEVCEDRLNQLYLDSQTAFGTDDFWAFTGLQNCTHEVIHLKWVEDLNDSSEQLAFMVNGDKLFAKTKLPGSQVVKPVDHETYNTLIIRVKAECQVAAAQLVYELRTRFPNHSVLDALGMVYPQYWGQGRQVPKSFQAHLDVLTDFYCEPKEVQDGDKTRLVPPLLDRWKLQNQQSMFKTAMMSNSERACEPPFYCNPLSRIWRVLSANSLTSHMISEYIKLAEIAVVHVIGSVEDERCFSTLGFLKNKLRNALNEHLPLVVGMFAQKMFTLHSFPYEAAFEAWLAGAERNGRYCLTA